MRVGAVIAATGAAAASLASSGYYVRALADSRWLTGQDLHKVVPVPAAMLPAGAVQKVAGRAMGPADRPVLAAAVWRDPLDQHLANLHYVDLVDGHADDSAVARQAQLLSALGWRDSSAQLNLILRSALAGDVAPVLDRADALLRRRKLLAPANQMLAAAEAVPAVTHLVAVRLAARPPWRSDYMVASAQSATPAFLAVRAATLGRLFAMGSPPSRREIAPVLSGLTAAGQGNDAYALWSRFVGPRRAGMVVNDPDFRKAGQLAAANETVLPFEWQLNADMGYGASPARDGAGIEINWDGKGVPVFLSQAVPVRAGLQYRLVIAGQGNATRLVDLFQPTLACGARQLAFEAVGVANTGVTFRSEPVPAGCAIAVLAIGARVRDDAAPVGAIVQRIVMTPSR